MPPLPVKHLARGLATVAAMAKALPVAAIPEQLPVTLVRRDVIHIRGLHNNAQLIAVLANRIRPQVNQARRLPFGICIEPPPCDCGWRGLRLFPPRLQLGLARGLVILAMRLPRQCDILAACSHADLRSRHRITSTLFESPQRKNARRFPVGACVDDANLLACR
jgi:hypothetical protein